MSLLVLTLGQFRNFSTARLDLAARFTVLHGENGAGKTNLLEAIYLVSTLRSFRTSSLRPLIRRGSSVARVRAEVDEAGLPTSLAVAIEQAMDAPTRRTAFVGDKPVRAATEFYGRLPAVLFTPEDLEVLRGPPGDRRQLLDRALFARERAHLEDVSRYEKLLRSRNAVLRDPSSTPADRERLLDTYDSSLAEVGGRIWERRVQAIARLRAPFVEAFAEIQGGTGTPDLVYESRVEEPGLEAGSAARGALLREALLSGRHADLRRGATSAGPHRDDVAVRLDGALAAEFASQGQTRTLILAFKIAELGTAQPGGAAPLLLLDDVSSELDPGRSERLFAALDHAAGQCVVTTTAPHFVPLPSGPERRDVEVVDGELRAG